MQAASFLGLLNTIFIIMLIYYALKFIGRYLIPIFFQKIARNMEEKIRKQQGFQNYNTTKEGETTIDKKSNDQKGNNKNVGEYIDYEEIDD